MIIESQIEFCKYELKGGNCKEYTDKGLNKSGRCIIQKYTQIIPTAGRILLKSKKSNGT